MSTRATRVRSKATVSSPSPAETVLPQATEAPDLTTLSETAAILTRSGRVSKPPVRYEPVEQVEDDYAPDDYDSYE